MLPPLISLAGQTTPNMPIGAAGKVIAVRDETVEMPAQIGMAMQYKSAQPLWDTIAQPPPHAGQELSQWCVISKEFNVALAGSPAALDVFVKQYGTVYNYIKATEFGTRFHNSVNFGIMNCSGKPLFQVDDTGADDVGTADIITIPTGENISVPLWDQQRANNMFNVDNTRPLVRAYRYELINVEANSYIGHMRERIYYWDKETLNEDGFLYIPQFHCCIFENFKDADAFIKKWQTVDNYEKKMIEASIYDAVNEHAEELERKMNLKNKLVIKGCAILLSLQVAWKLGEVFVYLIKENHEAKKETSGKKSFITSGFSGNTGILNNIGSMMVH
jgi:hypothetical protein